MGQASLYGSPMTSLRTVAQAVALQDPETARALHLISLWRGRMDALEVAIAEQDARARLRILMEAFDLFDELQSMTPAAREAA